MPDIILIENHRIFVTIVLFLADNYTRGEGSEEKLLYTKHVSEGVDHLLPLLDAEPKRGLVGGWNTSRYLSERVLGLGWQNQYNL